jgi:hypothetical protein
MKKKIISVMIIYTLLFTSIVAAISVTAFNLNNNLKSSDDMTPPIIPERPKILFKWHNVMEQENFPHITTEFWTLPDYPIVIYSSTTDPDDFEQERISFKVEIGEWESDWFLGKKNMFPPHEDDRWYCENTHTFPWNILTLGENSRTYSIRVKAKDATERKSEWSEPTELLVTKNPYEKEFEFVLEKAWMSPPSTLDDSSKNVLFFKTPYIQEKWDENPGDRDTIFYRHNDDRDLRFQINLFLEDTNDIKHTIFKTDYTYSKSKDYEPDPRIAEFRIKEGDKIRDLKLKDKKDEIECDYDFEILGSLGSDDTIKVFLPDNIEPNKIIGSVVFPETLLKIYYDEQVIKEILNPFELSIEKNVDPGITVEGELVDLPIFASFNKISYGGGNSDDSVQILHEPEYKDFIIYGKYLGDSTCELSVNAGLKLVGSTTITDIESYDHITDVEIEITRESKEKSLNIPIFERFLGKMPLLGMIFEILFK